MWSFIYLNTAYAGHYVYFTNVQFFVAFAAFIGLNDINSEGNFAWSDGTPVVYSGFKTGEPNNYGGNEDCALIHRQHGGKLMDIPCEQSKPFLCKRAWRTIETVMTNVHCISDVSM